MNILICGAGPLGSRFAARLQQGGHDVSLLARGQRLADLRKYGIVLRDAMTKQETVTHVNVIERLAPEDAHDLVLVIMRKNNVLDILPILAANPHAPNVLFLGNNFSGPGELVEALGRKRVLIGFPMAAGYREGHTVHYWAGTGDHSSQIPIGEADGSITDRTKLVAQALEQAPGFEVEMRTDMDAWLKTHVVVVMPSLAPALYMAGTDNYRLARTRDAVVLALRGIREGLRVLRALGVPTTPAKYRALEWLPEPFLVPRWQKAFASELWESVPIPTIERLYPHIDPDAPLIPDGSAEIPLDWRGVWIGLAALVAIALGLIVVLKLL